MFRIFSAAVVSAIICLSCTRGAMVDMSSDTDTPILFSAKQGWPEDTSGGLYATGIAKPTESMSGQGQLEYRAEHGALLRILGEMRNKGMIPRDISDTKFFTCIEEKSGVIHLTNNLQHVSAGNRHVENRPGHYDRKSHYGQ